MNDASDKPRNSTSSDSQSASSEKDASVPESQPRQARPRVFGRFAFWIVVFPFIFYLAGMMIGGYLEQVREMYLTGELEHAHHGEANRPPGEEVDIEEREKEVDPNDRFLLGLLPLGRDSYPYTYTFVIAVTTGLMLIVSWGYFRIPFRVTPWSVAVGVVGIVVWLGLAYLDRRFLHLGEMLSSGREAFNPFEELEDNRRWMWQFLAFRFWGLVVVVPVVEEFFVRGFLMRYVDDPDWDERPLGQAKMGGWIARTVYGVVAHLTEPLAALAWFSLVSWLYKKTGSIWDCVVAHCITNLLLGLYVVQFEAWHLW